MSKQSYFKSKAYEKLLQEILELFEKWNPYQEDKQEENGIRHLWHLGKKIATTKQSLNHGQKEKLISMIGQDLQKDRTQLFRLEQLYSLYPKSVQKVPGYPLLNWSHYQEVLRIKNDLERDFYLNTAAEEGWPSRRMRRAVRSKFYQNYQLSKSKHHPNGKLERVISHFFVYMAKLQKIKDPDTSDFLADQGFDSWQNLVGRLRGINAPELHGPHREIALAGTEFVQECIGDLEFVVIQSHKNAKGKFGRYLIDIFFHPIWDDPDKIYLEGFFLNQLLLDKCFASLALY